MVERDPLGPWYSEYFLSVRPPEEVLEAYRGDQDASLWVVSGEKRGGSPLTSWILRPCSTA